MKKQAVLSLSGGMDSSTVLLRLLADDYAVTSLSFDYGQKHRVELKRAKELINYLKDNDAEVTHQVIKLDGLGHLLNSHLVDGGDDVPEGHYEEANMVDTVVPNRNKIMNSIVQAVALSVSNRLNTDVTIAMGIHAGDHEIYPDCRQEFRDVDFEAFKIGNYLQYNVDVLTPYLDTDKYGILRDGQKCCDELKLDFNEVYKRTNTSYKPTAEGHSDYKSASSVERIEAFIKLGRPDPVQYADDSGIVGWEIARKHVEDVLQSHGGV
tara:strand:+ start:795 stop:1592 length:798 start_codon:yes stop_codon:yes gene_type:complete